MSCELFSLVNGKDFIHPPLFIYPHHVVMDAFLKANNFTNKDLRESKPRRSDEQDVVITSSEIRLSQIFISKVICI